MPRRLALLLATYYYQDAGLRQLTAPGHDAEALADVLRDPDIANFDVTILVNESYHVAGRAIGELYRDRARGDLALLYITGHGLKDDEGRLYFAMTDTARDDLLFTALSAQQIDYAMDSCSSRQKVLVLDCCYSGAFPAGRISKGDTHVHTLERFQGKGRVVLTASDATQYSFEGNDIIGQGTRSVFTRFLVAGLTTGEADLDGDGDISLDELYSYVYDHVVDEIPQQRPKKQENVEGRIVIARNIHWSLPVHIGQAIESPFVPDRLRVLEGLAHLHRNGNDIVRAEVINQTRRLIHDDNEEVSTAAMQLITALDLEQARHKAETWEDQQSIRSSKLSAPGDNKTVGNGRLGTQAWTKDEESQRIEKDTGKQGLNIAERSTSSSRSPKTVQRASQNEAARKGRRQNVTRTRVGGYRGPLERWAPPQLTRRKIVLTVSTTLVVISLVIVLVVTLTRTTTTIPGVTATIAVGMYPQGVALTPDDRRVYITNANANTVSVIDTANNIVAAIIPVDWHPWDIAVTPDGRQVYVANDYSGTVSVIDTATNNVSATIHVGTPTRVAVTPDSRHVYITNNAANTTSVIDTANNTVSATIPVGVGPRGVTVTSDGRHAYVANDGSGTISVIDTANNSVIGTIPIGSHLGGVRATPDNREIYSANPASGTVSMINTANGAVTATIPVGSQPGDVTVAPNGRYAYVTNYNSDNVSVIDVTNSIVTATITVGSRPSRVAVTSDARHAYVTNAGSNTVSVINTGAV